MYSINFTLTRKEFCLSLHYNGTNNHLYVNGKEMVKFKAKDSEIAANSLFRKNFKRLVIRRTGLKGCLWI